MKKMLSIEKAEVLFIAILRKATPVDKPILVLNAEGKAHPQDFAAWFNAWQFRINLDRNKYNDLFDILNQIYPAQLDPSVYDQWLYAIAKSWLATKADINDDQQVTAYWELFLQKIVLELIERTVFLPVVGVQVLVDEAIPLGLCLLHNNGEASELQDILRLADPNAESQLDEVRNSLAFLKVVVVGHSSAVVEKAEEYGRIGLGLLRLYIGTYYKDGYSGAYRRLEILGKHRHAATSIRIVHGQDPIGKGSVTTFSYSWGGQEDFVVDAQVIQQMNMYGLLTLNKHLQNALAAQDNQLSWRFVRAINAFAKATIAESPADSFLYLAIAVEALLSEGRTSQETYATQVAALVTKGKLGTIYPMGGTLEAQMESKLQALTDRSDAFNLVRQTVIELFNFRNEIAHGKLQETEMDLQHLATFETLVRNAILSFALGGWNGIQDFKNWIKQRVKYQFSV